MRALILGSTGLVGNELFHLLLSDNEVTHIYTVGRRSTGVSHEKVSELVVDLEQLTSLKEVNADVLFIAFGTTIKNAGSQENQERIDVDIPTHIMKLAKEAGIKSCALVSSVGVSEKSPFFYSRMKARLDRNAKEIGFDQLVLVKPSVLDGDRKEKRAGEKFSITLGNLIGKTGLINAYKPVKAKFVAATMIQAIKEHASNYREIASSEIPAIAKNYMK